MQNKIVLNKYITDDEGEFLQVHQSLLDNQNISVFDVISDTSYWEPKEDMYYLSEEDTKQFKSRLSNTQISTTFIQIPYTPWQWEELLLNK